MDAASSIVTYSIESPKIHDIVVFYDPVRSNEIFRVTGIRTPVNALFSTTNIHWFELELEYAPIPDTLMLKILGHYVYDLSLETYITFLEYQKLFKQVNDLENILNQMITYYDKFYDLYQIEMKVPIEVNEVLIYLKKEYTSKYRRLFEKLLLTKYYSLPFFIGE